MKYDVEASIPYDDDAATTEEIKAANKARKEAGRAAVVTAENPVEALKKFAARFPETLALPYDTIWVNARTEEEKEPVIIE